MTHASAVVLQVWRTLCSVLGVATALAGGMAVSFAAEVRTWTNAEGRTMEAELVAVELGQPVFLKDDGREYLHPLENLSAADQAMVRSAQVPVRSTGETARRAEVARLSRKTTGTTRIESPRQPPAPTLSPLSRALQDRVFRRLNRTWSAVPAAELAGVRYVAVYFSAHWCAPCREFTPELVAAYARLKRAHPEFEIVFVSSDESEQAMAHYMESAGMSWLALRFSKVRDVPAIWSVREEGIPNLVLLGQDGTVLARSYVNGVYRGPHAALRQIERILESANTAQQQPQKQSAAASTN